MGTFVDRAVLAAGRTLPTWSDMDLPPIPSAERKAVKELQDECRKMLAEYPTTAEQDQKLLDSISEARTTFATAIKYRMHRKMFIGKIIKALDLSIKNGCCFDPKLKSIQSFLLGISKRFILGSHSL